MIRSNKKFTIKFLVYITVFIVTVLLFVFIFIVPSINKYKSSKLESVQMSKKSEHLLLEQEKLEKTLYKTKQESKKLEKLFANKFNKSEFIEYSKKYFHDIKLVKIENKSKGSALDIYNFDAKVNTKNPRLLYDFINNLSQYKNIVKINFPVKISSNQSSIDINFHLSIYSMKHK